MLLERGAVKIMDFGIARMRHADHKTQHRHGARHAALHVARAGRRPAGGPALRHLLARHRAVRDAHRHAAVRRRRRARRSRTTSPTPSRRRRRAVNPEVPQMLDFVVARALKKDPAVRYQDAYEMAADLRDALAEMRGRSPAPRSDRHRGDAHPEARGRRRRSCRSRPRRAPSRATRACRCRACSTARRRSSGLPRPASASAWRVRRGVGLPRRIWRDRLPRRLFAAALIGRLLRRLIASGERMRLKDKTLSRRRSARRRRAAAAARRRDTPPHLGNPTRRGARRVAAGRRAPQAPARCRPGATAAAYRARWHSPHARGSFSSSSGCASPRHRSARLTRVTVDGHASGSAPPGPS